jgi:5-methylcytosine-specific restriction enzyme subunit McrC
MMQEQFDKQTIHSGNLYQIFTYVKNLDKDNTGLVSGMLLYARTQEEIAPDLDATFGKNRILVRTLDLNCDFFKIQEQLDDFVTFIN